MQPSDGAAGREDEPQSREGDSESYDAAGTCPRLCYPSLRAAGGRLPRQVGRELGGCRVGRDLTRSVAI